MAHLLVVEEAGGEESVALHVLKGQLPGDYRRETGEASGGKGGREVVVLVASQEAQDVSNVAVRES